MRLERMLTDALRDEAESREVDVTGLWAQTRERVEQQPPPRPRRRTAVLAAAAAAALVVAGVAGLTQLGGNDRLSPAGPADGLPREGTVDDHFTCPEQVVHDWTRPESVVDKHFVATLYNGLDFQARGYDVPMYELEVEGERAFASFGNADGTLALRSEFHREDGEWARYRSEVCTGVGGSVAVPVEEPLALRNHLGGEPFPPSDLSGRDPRLLDHRSFYDHVGVVRARSLYAGACGREAVCLSSVRERDGSSIRVRPGLRPRDVSWVFLPDDAPEWRSQPYGMWALYDADGTVSDLSLDLEDGQILWARKHEAPGRPGTLYTLVAPYDEVGALTVHHAPGAGPLAGEGRTFLPQDLPGYRADLRD